VAHPRQIAMYLCRVMVPNLSLNEIGEAFGGKDHTTVLYACDKINEAVKTKPEIAQVVNHIQRSIRQ
jgi:chromosomal replication initiator protein